MDIFSNVSRYPMIPFEEAWRIVEAQARPLTPERLPLEQLAGLVLAEEVLAADDWPPFPAATMDGYALRTADGLMPRRIIGEREAGRAEGARLTEGTCLRIMTGAPLPEGADAVLAVEEAEEKEGMMIPHRAVHPGENIRPIGADVRAGSRVLAAGVTLGPAEIGLLASLNRGEALAYRRPRVAILTTGDEVVPPGQPLGPGQIPNSNALALAAAVTLHGGSVALAEHVPDEAPALRQALERATNAADIVLTSGGVSMGTRDLIKPLLEELGTVHFGRVAIKPGKPLTFATVGRTYVLGLPGNPVSSLVMFEMVVRPLMRILAGHRAIHRPRVQARLRHAVRHEPDRLEFQRARLMFEGDTWWAETTGSQISSRLLSLAGANALLCVPRGVGNMPAGAAVEAIRLDLPETETSL